MFSIRISVANTRKKNITCFDVYTKEGHIFATFRTYKELENWISLR
jgi:hypothetical protein